jgi:Cof subfamily protein (haloacid dehalogenase superfamily)
MNSIITFFGLWLLTTLSPINMFKISSYFTKKFSTTKLPAALISEQFLSQRNIKCILCDVDGTTLNEEGKLSERTSKAIINVIDHGVPFYFCTGRSRFSVSNVVDFKLLSVVCQNKSLKLPGVFTQGLEVFDREGELLDHTFLTKETLSKITQSCQEVDVPLLAYSGDTIYTKKNCKDTMRVVSFNDPVPIEYSKGVEYLIDDGIVIHKVIVSTNNERIPTVRKALEEKLEGVSFTTAVPGLLEILPGGTSKGYGVAKLLKYLEIDPTNCVAFGDGENDIEMLQLVGTGVAMGNAKDILKNVATAVTLPNSEDGLAYALEMILKVVPKMK